MLDVRPIRPRAWLLVLAMLVGAGAPACQPATSLRPESPSGAASTGAPPAPAARPAPPASAQDQASDPDIQWLVEHSMLHQGDLAARRVSGTGAQWQHPYALPEPRAASALASVWFTAYPPSQITGPGESVLESLGDADLWRIFRDIGIGGMHTGPMKRAGGLRGREYTPTVDGNFDRISSEIDPAFGTQAQFTAMVRRAADNHAVVIGDIIPGHSGKGADFRLAERRYGDYPGLYHMVEIGPEDWGLLPAVPAGRDSVNLKPATVDALRARGYIVGQLPRTIFYEPGVKETDWSATDAVVGADGQRRRWVYLHYFKEGQPTFNWLDPTFAAPRLVAGDAINALAILGERMLRLDANGFLGIEAGPDNGRAWSEGHPLSVTANQLIAGLVRKLGGFTFQELNLTLEDVKAMSEGGADLSYDFISRPAYQHALVTGDASFLRLMLGLQRTYQIDPASLIHALQNHDELTLELVHFWTKHKDTTFTFRGKAVKGSALRDTIRAEMHGRLMGAAAPYNLKAANGISCTSVTVAAAALGIRDLGQLTEAQRHDIRRAHLLLALFNAMQPGVFALSGWDLVGALTLPDDAVGSLIAEGDTRWINRGAYDLLGKHPSVTTSGSGLPRARALYGPLPEQLQHGDSFASQLRAMLRVRAQYRINESEQVAVPAVRAPGLVVMVHRLPRGAGIQVTAVNFARAPVREAVAIEPAPAGGAVTDLLASRVHGKLGAGKRLPIALGPHEGQVLLIK
ncbi:MAG TPA: maltose alpha-D-glucosyltransferase [Methylomirabilota bacterium]|nr:maltose alpha-D-glucosyltransferase [Methylomirabilota bacterium]